MAGQEELFGGGTAPYQRHSDTSKAAAARIADGLTGLRRDVWRAIYEMGSTGATDEDVQRVLELNPSTQRPRRIELVKRGLVVDTGRRRSTQSGRKAVVWAAVVR